MTKAERRRALILKESIGCIACRKYGHEGVPSDLHHIISEKTGRRISHLDSYPLCKIHHTLPGGSRHRNSRWFTETFGTDEYLLSEANRLVAAFESSVIGGKS